MESSKVEERIKNAINRCCQEENILWSNARIILKWQRQNEEGLHPVFEIQLYESQRKVKNLTLFKLLGITALERMFISSEESLTNDLIEYFETVCVTSNPSVSIYKSMVMFFLHSAELNLGIQLFSENKFVRDVTIDELIEDK